MECAQMTKIKCPTIKRKKLKRRASQNSSAVLSMAVAFITLLAVQDSVLQKHRLHITSALNREKHKQEQLVKLQA